MNQRVVFFGGNDSNTRIIFNALASYYPFSLVIIETKRDKSLLIKRRIKRLGFWKVFGQLIFRATIVPLLFFFSKKRITNIFEQYNLNDAPINSDIVHEVATINDPEVLMWVKKIRPVFIIVNGTRIISKEIIDGVGCPLINLHVGITPKYRGVHGMYWALAMKDEKNAGVTVHQIDAGIDTGYVLRQAKVRYSREDNFVTYPILQIGEGIKLLILVIDDFLSKRISTQGVDLPSQLWSHPTIWQYLFFYFTKGVK